MFNVLLGTTFFSRFRCQFGFQRGCQGRTHEGPTNYFFGYFFHRASFGRPAGAQDRQNIPREDESFTNRLQNDPKGAKTPSQKPANEPNHLRNETIDRSIDSGTVAGLPQGAGYIHIYIYTYIQIYLSKNPPPSHKGKWQDYPTYQLQTMPSKIRLAWLYTLGRVWESRTIHTNCVIDRSMIQGMT